MKEVELYGGTIDSCLKSLREMAAADESGEVLKAVFNDKYLLSTDSDDDAYLRITGKTKAEHDEYMRKWREDYEARRKAHEARIPELTEHYRKEARGVIIESELEYWDKIVPIRLGDLYRGMELDQVLDCARVMRDETLSRIERLRKAYKIFNDAGHSGMSAGLTMAMLRRVRKVTGHTAEQIAAGHPKPIADAIQLLLTVGIIDAGKVYADICWEVCLEQATAAIQARIARISEE